MERSGRSYLQRPSSGGNGGNSGSRKTTGSIRSTPLSTSQWRRATARQAVSGKNTWNCQGAGKITNSSSNTLDTGGSRIPVPKSLETSKYSPGLTVSITPPQSGIPTSRIRPPGKLDLERSYLVTSTEIKRLPPPPATSRERTLRSDGLKPRAGSMRHPLRANVRSSSNHLSSPDTSPAPPLSLPSVPTYTELPPPSSSFTSHGSRIPLPRIYSRNNSSDGPPSFVSPQQQLQYRSGVAAGTGGGARTRGRSQTILSPNTRNRRMPQPQQRPVSSGSGDSPRHTPSDAGSDQGCSPRGQVHRLPLTPQVCKQEYGLHLSPFERKEIEEYPEIWYLGLESKKIQAEHGASQNAGYDDENGSYIKVLHDHIAYRYEIREVIGKGSFGQVVKCFDHKTKQPVAIKIIRNKKRFHHQALVEVKILDSLRKKVSIN
ncbi:Dual specificity tyrosine-phosphorylation-regulated kinase 4 [Geodia barretti]|uniref:dual-specificity kinase n=1 Tax=Geodia barretti TaxID=519541 RepID=A0AA35XD72_GEOBA|nr:Dual specificity tyrosine-phosphorylation-regulated kinase 4 [Geodia barretti]